jgi:hypothetical protein
MKKLINKYGWLLQDLNQDEKQILGGGIVAVLGFSFLIWLASTNTLPVLDAKTRNQQTHQEQSYELNKNFDKYVNRIYNEKYGK